MRMIIPVLLLIAAAPALAQSPAPASPQKTLASTLNVYVFPTAGQDAAQQSTDEADCYGWAVTNTGSDPFDLANEAQQDAAQAEAATKQAAASTQGAGVRGAVGGAAVGALIGEIADDDPGKGAAYGAATGAIVSRRSARRGAAQQQQQIQQQSQQTQQATAEQIETFKKAFSVCLEAKSYMAKF